MYTCTRSLSQYSSRLSAAASLSLEILPTECTQCSQCRHTVFKSAAAAAVVAPNCTDAQFFVCLSYPSSLAAQYPLVQQDFYTTQTNASVVSRCLRAVWRLTELLSVLFCWLGSTAESTIALCRSVGVWYFVRHQFMSLDVQIYNATHNHKN